MVRDFLGLLGRDEAYHNPVHINGWIYACVVFYTSRFPFIVKLKLVFMVGIDEVLGSEVFMVD